MNIQSVILLIIIIVLMIVAIVDIFRNKKNNPCRGCGMDCNKCSNRNRCR